MRRYDVARFAVSHDALEDGDRVELHAVGILDDGVIIIRAATVAGPEEKRTLMMEDDSCAG